MKRFYCTLCKRVVRAHSLPKDASTSAPASRSIAVTGTCKHHTRNERNVVENSRRFDELAREMRARSVKITRFNSPLHFRVTSR